MLWILYLGYFGLGLGLLTAAAHLAGVPGLFFARAASHVHIIGMGGFAMLIIEWLRARRWGHTGRP